MWPESPCRRRHASHRADSAGDRDRLGNLLADYCLGWPRHGESYALRFAARHLWEVGRWDELGELLSDQAFLEERIKANQVFELGNDLEGALARLPARHPCRATLEQVLDTFKAEIRQALQGLPVLYREALTLKKALNYSDGQIAELLGVDMHMVEKRLSGGLSRLSRRLLEIRRRERRRRRTSG
jgi:DNA-directed RNA polymerase specialized sigma24 family protein